MNEKAIENVQYCACFRLRAAARKVTRDYEDALKPVRLRVTQFTLLSMIKAMRPNSITTLAEEVGMDRTALNRALNIMKKNGWVTVGKSGDKLEKKIRLTKAGKTKLEVALPLWNAAQQKFISEAGNDEWRDHRNWLIDIAGGKHY